MGYRCVGGMSVPHVGRVGNEYLHLRGCRWWYEEDAKKVGLFLHLRSCRPERTMEKRAYNTRRIISGVELASFHALSLFRLASLFLSLSHLLLFSTALTLLSKFHFLALSVFFDYYIYIPSYTYSCNKNMPSNRSLGQLEYMLHSVLRMFV